MHHRKSFGETHAMVQASSPPEASPSTARPEIAKAQACHWRLVLCLTMVATPSIEKVRLDTTAKTTPTSTSDASFLRPEAASMKAITKMTSEEHMQTIVSGGSH